MMFNIVIILLYDAKLCIVTPDETLVRIIEHVIIKLIN